MDDKGQVYFSADDKEIPEEDAKRLEEATRRIFAREQGNRAFREFRERRDRFDEQQANATVDWLAKRAERFQAECEEGQAAWDPRKSKGE